MGDGLKMAAVGVAVGLGGAFVAARGIRSWLFGVGASDPWTFAAVSVLLVVVAAVACYVPARRAMRTDPMAALRAD
jgi:ABC-type antimicrobial peptide transport system permease subunit